MRYLTIFTISAALVFSFVGDADAWLKDGKRGGKSHGGGSHSHSHGSRAGGSRSGSHAHSRSGGSSSSRGYRGGGQHRSGIQSGGSSRGSHSAKSHSGGHSSSRSSSSRGYRGGGQHRSGIHFGSGSNGVHIGGSRGGIHIGSRRDGVHIGGSRGGVHIGSRDHGVHVGGHRSGVHIGSYSHGIHIGGHHGGYHRHHRGHHRHGVAFYFDLTPLIYDSIDRHYYESYDDGFYADYDPIEASYRRAGKLLEAGDVFFRRKNYPQALGQYEAAANAAPTLAPTYFRIGHGLIALQDYPGAARAFKDGIEQDPTIAQTVLSLDQLYGNDKATKEAHLEGLAAATLVEPKNADLYFLLGVFLQNDGQIDRSQRFFRQANKLAGKNNKHLQEYLKIGEQPKQPVKKEAPQAVGL